ncbi:MAG: hypothetical protein JNL90_10610 [Planctomycetes bacterium]|nr:hypothetical protein [Planctomycetota bacterium]
MTPAVVVTSLIFTPSDAASAATGRLGWLEFDVGPLHITDVQVRKSANGRVYLSFSRFRRVDRRGREHFALRPANDDARLALEIAVITALRLRPEEAAS